MLRQLSHRKQILKYRRSLYISFPGTLENNMVVKMNFSDMKSRLMDHQARAQTEITYIKEHPGLSREELHEHIYEYVLFKYNLSGEVKEVFQLSELADLSVAKAIRLSREQSVAYDNKASCDGATSAMNKKVLLLMAIQRELGIQFPLDQTAGITTTWRLAEVVKEQLEKK